MITAIPVNDDRVANHFTKASHLVLVDERGVELSRTENPALGADCSGKRKLVDLLVQSKSAALWSVTSGNGCWVNYWGIRSRCTRLTAVVVCSLNCVIRIPVF